MESLSSLLLTIVRPSTYLREVVRAITRGLRRSPEEIPHPRPRSTWPNASAGGLACMLWVALVSSPFASAQWQTSPDAEACVTGIGVLSLDIAICGRALRSEALSELDRASVFTARGRAYRHSGRLVAALADFEAALALNPYSANTFNERGLALDETGHYEQALEDFRRALALSPRFAAAYKNRGMAHFYAGVLTCAAVDLEAAAALAPDDAEIDVFRGFLHYLAGRYRDSADDFQRVHALDLPYPYLPLWRYLVSTASGDSARRELIEARAALLPGEWPLPLLDAYLGERGPDALIATLEADDRSPTRQLRVAASHYYLAALERLNGQQEQALSRLGKTMALFEHRMPERVLAEHALAVTQGEQPSTPAAGC